jgi:hypothetical protein
MVNERIADLESRMEKLELQVARKTLQQDAGVKISPNEGPSNPSSRCNYGSFLFLALAQFWLL